MDCIIIFLAIFVLLQWNHLKPQTIVNLRHCSSSLGFAGYFMALTEHSLNHGCRSFSFLSTGSQKTGCTRPTLYPLTARREPLEGFSIVGDTSWSWKQISHTGTSPLSHGMVEGLLLFKNPARSDTAETIERLRSGDVRSALWMQVVGRYPAKCFMWMNWICNNCNAPNFIDNPILVLITGCITLGSI